MGMIEHLSDSLELKPQLVALSFFPLGRKSRSFDTCVRVRWERAAGKVGRGG